MNGLNDGAGLAVAVGREVERAGVEVEPPTIALTSPVLFSIATSEASGPTPASRPAIACSAAAWSSGSIVVLIFSPPPKTSPAP